MDPSRAMLEKRARSGPKPQRSAMASTAMAPMLWRFLANLVPGLPRPARISMADPSEGSALGFGLAGCRLFGSDLFADLGGGGLRFSCFGGFGLHGRGGGDGGDDGGLRVAHGMLDARRQGDVGGADGVADVEAGEVHQKLVWDLVGG